jgi:hypothetical protein
VWKKTPAPHLERKFEIAEGGVADGAVVEEVGAWAIGGNRAVDYLEGFGGAAGPPSTERDAVEEGDPLF